MMKPGVDGASLPGVWVVIAAYNEAPMIGRVIDGLSTYVQPGCVIVIDDASTDATSANARASGAVVLRHPVNRGQGAALQTGITAALSRGAEVVVTFDADDQHDPADLPGMVEPILTHQADVVLGSRFTAGAVSNVPKLRRTLLRCLLWATRLMTRLKITDAHNGFRAFNRPAAACLDIRRDRMEHASELLDQVARHRLAYVERPTSVRYSAYSMAKGQKNGAAIQLAINILRYKVSG